VLGAIIVAFLGILGTLIGSYLQGMSNLNLEKLKFETDLIAKVVSNNDIQQNKKNLKFLLDAGLIRDTGNKIKQLVADSTFDLNIRKDNIRSDHFWVAGRVEDENGVPLENVGVYVDNDALPVTNCRPGGTPNSHPP
jgi:hypothetical protein